MNDDFIAAEELLQRGAAALSFPVNQEVIEKLMHYLQLLAKWNRVHNLTAIREPQQQVIVHLLDSLVVAPFLPPAQTIADIGSGAGLPGIVLAIVCPQQQFFFGGIEYEEKRFFAGSRAAIGVGECESCGDARGTMASGGEVERFNQSCRQRYQFFFDVDGSFG